MRRLSLTIFLAVLGSLAVFAAAVSVAWWWNLQVRDDAFERRLAAVLAAEILPASAEGPHQLQRVLERWHRRARVDLVLLDTDGSVVASAGVPAADAGPRGGAAAGPQADPGPREARPHAGPATGEGRAEGGRRLRREWRRQQPWTIDIELADGRRLLARPDRPRRGPPPLVSPALAIGLLMLAGALVAWPVSRRITSRLVRLQAGVDRQAAGDLRVRVPVEGRDEVAVLARSFNQSAERIEALVNRQEELLASQKRLLANASHELRSPLARIRMALELLLADPNEAGHFADELRRNIAELDQLVDEILLASRLETTPMARESVDLAGLAAEEASRVDAVAASDDGDTPLVVTGDPRLLRRLLRNLLENASRHGDGAGEPVRIELAREAESVRIAVLDRGPGVPPESRERIFEPFYRVGGHSEQSGGVGLGLALVRQIASAHGGDARCEAREGGGSRFVVSLPVAGPRPGPPPDSPAARCGPS